MKNLIVVALFVFFSGYVMAQVTNYGTQSGDQGTNAGYFGYQSGKNANGAYNTFIGDFTGRSCSANFNTFLGYWAGINTTTGAGNTFLGAKNGQSNTSGVHNTTVGFQSAEKMTTGSKNTFTGFRAGFKLQTGSNNTLLGTAAGYLNTSGSGNVFVGNFAGYNELGSDLLYIDNSSTHKPLIKGDFANNELFFNGRVQIGDVSMVPGYELFVEKGILTEKVKVAPYGSIDWADFVFADDYELNSIEHVKQFVEKNDHLPNVPSAKEVNQNGVDMVEMDATLLRQIEELWLHVIQINEELKTVKKENDLLKETLNK